MVRSTVWCNQFSSTDPVPVQLDKGSVFLYLGPAKTLKLFQFNFVEIWSLNHNQVLVIIISAFDEYYVNKIT